MILNQTDFFARSATLNGAISDTDTQITLSGLSTRFTDAVAAGTVRYPLGPFRVSDDDGFELIAITGHVSGSTFEFERGIQGTDALTWGDGTALRAVVTRDTLRGLLSPVQFPFEPAIYDPLSGKDGEKLNDFPVAPTGQTWIAGDNIVFADGGIRRALGSGGDRTVLVTAPASRGRFISLWHAPTSTLKGLYVAYQDDQNFIELQLRSSGTLVILVNDNGSSEIVVNQGASGSSAVGTPAPFWAWVFSRGSNWYLRCQSPLREGGPTTHELRQADLDLIDRSTQTGIEVTSDSSPTKQFVYYEL